MNLKLLSDEALSRNLVSLVREERRIGVEVLHHLREVERRRLFAAHGHSSLFTYCVTDLGYSEGSAQRRISSMRLLKDIPELEEKLKSGELTVTAACQAQTFFKKEGLKTNEAKREVLEAIGHKSTREVERELMRRSSRPESLIPEQVRPTTGTLSRLELTVENEFLEKIEELRALLSHAKPDLDLRGAIAYAVDVVLAKHRVKPPRAVVPPPALAVTHVPVSPPAPAFNPAPPASVAAPQPAPPASVAAPQPAPPASVAAPQPAPPAPKVTRAPSRYIPAPVRRAVYARDGGRCTFTSSQGHRCGSRFRLQYDHIQAFARGGPTTADNLRLRCFQHNQLAADQAFGRGP